MRDRGEGPGVDVDAAIRRYETNVAIPSVLSLSYGDDPIIAAE